MSYVYVGAVCAVLGCLAGLLVARKNPQVAAAAATAATDAEAGVKKL